jgi:hypothetical protein
MVGRKYGIVAKQFMRLLIEEEEMGNHYYSNSTYGNGQVLYFTLMSEHL